MNKTVTTALAAFCMLGMTACGDTQVNKTTSTRKETKIDGDGNQKTKIETKTEETSVRDSGSSNPNNGVKVVHERTIEVKRDPVVKLGPLEIHD